MEMLQKIGAYCLNNPYIYALIVLILAPVAGIILTGVDRKLTARMQGSSPTTTW